MMCEMNKAIKAFQQGKHANKEILHPVTNVLHAIPKVCFASFSAARTQSDVQGGFSDTGPQSSKCFVLVHSYYSPRV